MVVPTYRRPHELPGLVKALAGQTLDPSRFEVVVVDDGSGDTTPVVLAELAEWAPFELRVVVGAHGGAAATRNRGWRAARADLVAFTDDDCLPEPGWLEAGLARMSTERRLGVLQGRTTKPPEVDVSALSDWYQWRTVERAGPHFESCNIFYRRAALEQAGGFEESYGIWGEDCALGWSVVEAGWKRGFEESAWVVHRVDQRGWRWHLRTGLKETNLVRVAAEHPGYRAEAWWKPWAPRARDAAFVLAVGAVVAAGAVAVAGGGVGAAGGVSGLRARRAAGLALAGSLPYVWLGRPSVRRPHFLRLCLQSPVVDAARVVGQIRGAVRHRVFVI